MSKLLSHVEETYARLLSGDQDAIMDALMLIMQKNHGIYLEDSESVKARAKEIQLMRARDAMAMLPR